MKQDNGSPSQAGSVVHATGLTGLPGLASGLGTVDLLSLVSPGRDEDGWRHVLRDRHLILRFNDITAPRDDLILPDEKVVQSILNFARTVISRPLVVHCWAGISRSSAAAYIIACDRSAGRERELALELRARAPFATPNILMVDIADRILQRGGVMTDAIRSIGRGAEAFEGSPYFLPLEWTGTG